MGLLDRIKGFKDEGFSDSQVYQKLSEEGSNPREVKDAISQSNIKDAVTNAPQDISERPMPEMPQQQMMPEPFPQNQQFQQQGNQFQQSMGGYESSQDPMAPPMPSQGQVPAPGQQMTEDYSQMPQQYQDPEGEQYYDDQSYQSQPQGAFDLNTINDIAEQVVLEKTKKMHSELASIKEFKSLIEAQVNRLEQSTKHIEKIINDLQSSIIQKIGEYGEGIGEIKSEMNMMQDSFGKVLPELVEKRQVRHVAKKKAVRKKAKKKRTTKKKSTKKKVKKRK